LNQNATERSVIATAMRRNTSMIPDIERQAFRLLRQLLYIRCSVCLDMGRSWLRGLQSFS
jgi:hypothetical protein